MLIDYYQILGTTPEASLEAIKAAYRKKARECHPDIGGSHEAMVRVNEAWQVLSNPMLRAEYDKVRQQHHDRTVIAKWEKQSEPARERAKDYPKTWQAFQKGLDVLARDVTNAQYGTHRIWFFILPTSSRSLSGAIFIIIGALGVGLIALSLDYGKYLKPMLQPKRVKVADLPPIESQNYRPPHNIYRSPLSLRNTTEPKTYIENPENYRTDPNHLGRILAMALFGLPWMIGAWIGAFSHQYLQSALKGPTGKAPNEEAQSCVVTCPKCKARLRVPLTNSVLSVTCTRCLHTFDHKRSTSS